jgi:hypothetical protein
LRRKYIALFSPLQWKDRVLIDDKRHAIVWDIVVREGLGYNSRGEFEYTLRLANKNWEPQLPSRLAHYFPSTKLVRIREGEPDLVI